MEASIPVRPGPVRETDSREPEVLEDGVPEDGLNYTGQEHAVDPPFRNQELTSRRA
jgi:hypothetical protein